jgi:DedD protein
MPSREPELYKDKIEVSLDGRQIFYLFFGGAVIVGLVFVLGVLVGRRVEARGHIDRAETQAESDPLAALDRLERSDRLSFHGALRGGEATTDVEKAIGELEKRRAAARVDKKPEPSAAAAAKPDAETDEPVTRPEQDRPRADKSDKKQKKHDDEAAESRSEPRSDAKSSDAKLANAKPTDAKSADAKPADAKPTDAKSDGKSDRPDGKRAAQESGKSDKTVTRPDAKPDGKDSRSAETKPDSDAKPASEAKARFTLQLSSFQDKSEADAFLAATKSAGFQPYVVEADVTGKGTFYRVRLGSYRSLDAANDAKADYERTAKKTAQVTRL